VTDGVDHDWTITWSLAEAPQSPAGLAGWTTRAIAAGESAAAAAGYRAGPYVEPIAELDPTQGYETPAYGPRFSTGYFALRNRATILVETHSHKPFRDRVAANREFLAGVLAETARTGSELVAASAAADRAAVADRSPVVVDWETAAPGDDRRRFPIYEWRVERSVATGEQLLRFRRGVVREVEAPWRHGAAAARTVPRPAAYLVSAGWTRIADRLAIHGVRFERLAAPRELEVETLHVADAKPSARVYQGLVGLSARVERRRATIRFAAGDLWIPGDQPLFALAANLLEPEAEDSLFAWGLLSSIVEVREWIGPGELEDEAVRLLREPAVRAEWEAALADPAFAADAAARYRWWFERTPYFDESIGRLPVFRVPAGAELNAGR
jgi:hypothetical protein